MALCLIVMTKRFAGCAAGGLLFFALSTAAWGDRTVQERRPREDPHSGPYLYRTFCTSCHGPGGRGDGRAVVTLRVPPPDLTTIAERRGGMFPSDEIAQIIDGRKPLAGHARIDMPQWGRVLGRLELIDDATVKARVDALVAHLESMQRKP